MTVSIEKIEKDLADMDDAGLSRLGENLQRIAKFAGNRMLQQFLAKRIAHLSKRLEAVERQTGIKKSIMGQDSDDDSDQKWPSIVLEGPE